MPWSMAALSAVSDSCDESLLSKPTISNFGPPAQFLALARSATYFQLLSWLMPTGAIRPDCGSIRASLTVWAWARDDNEANATAAAAARTVNLIMKAPPREA